MRAAYEDRLAEARAELDEAASRQLLERNSFKSEVSEVMSRQARLEQRGAIVVALAAETEARNAPRRASRDAPCRTRCSAIQALGPPTDGRRGAGGAARAYAPLSDPRRPVARQAASDRRTGGKRERPALRTRRSRRRACRQPRTISTPRRALRWWTDRSTAIENSQTKALAAIDRAAERCASRDAAIVAEAGLDPAKLSPPHGQGGVGGPYIPAEIDAHALARDPALERVARDVATAERLKALLSFVPLRMPLSGDPSLTSRFGYRVDPFLGRLALHPGVDLAEPYGAEIHAAAAGRVVHAGPAGGYGIMVEIDHGNGLATRYAHMSEALVEEGEDGRQGRRPGPARFDRPLDRAASALRSARRRRAGRSRALFARRSGHGRGLAARPTVLFPERAARQGGMDVLLFRALSLLGLAILVALAARRLRLPYTVGLVLAGAALAATRSHAGPRADA